MTTHYKTLNIPPTATITEIKSAYRRLSLETHPDLHGACPRKAEQFKRISEAYSVLGSENSKRIYDLEIRDGLHGLRNAASARKNRGYPNGAAGGPSFGYTLPRNVLIGSLLGITGVTIFNTLQPVKNKESIDSAGKTKLVEAWLNPKTRRYEKPRPWDEEFRRIKPNLVMVRREEVYDPSVK